MPVPHTVLAAPHFDDMESRPLSWLDHISVHINTPLYPSYRESALRADDAADLGRCACPGCSGASPSDPQFFMPPQSGVASNGLPIYSYDQAAAQITRQSGGWGAGAVVTYGFRATEPAAMPGVTGFVPFNSAQIAIALESLALWSEVANITFVRVADQGEYTNNATILFSNYTSGADGASAFAYYPGASANAGDVWINFSLATNNSNLIEGAFGPHTMSHEIGHAIGLAHPANYDALAGVDPVYPDSAVYWQDSRMYTVMSYFGSAGPGGSLGAFASGPQLHDIAASQLLYGANMTTRTGNTVYGFNSNTGHTHFTITADEATPVFAIWDAGGNDTLDLSGYSSAVEIDLREESFSSAGPGTNTAVNNGRAYGNISIARGAVIENGIGGAGNDTIIGNGVANALTGNAGNDTLNGGAGVDTSIYTIASTSATWVRNPNGSWTVTVGADGADTVTGVEYLDFTDRDVFLDRAAQTFTGDGTSDLLLRNSAGTLSLWFVQGASITGAGIGSITADWTSQSGDFNGDGRDDILWRNTSNGSMSMWFMNAAAVTGAAFNTVATNWVIEGLGDFNGDTRDDILWRDSSSGAMSLWFLDGQAVSGGAFGNVAANWIVETLGDFNGDGRDDILWRDGPTGAMSMWLMNGQAVTGGAFGNVGAPWVVEGAGDFNGDGRDDIFWRNSTTGDVSLWFMNGQAVTGTAGFGLATTWQAEGLGDYNGDGRDDIIWRDGTGSVVAWFVNGASITGQSLGSLSTDWVINPGG